MARISISYRSEEGKPHKRLLFERLSPLSTSPVVLDVVSLVPGEDLRNKIECGNWKTT